MSGGGAAARKIALVCLASALSSGCIVRPVEDRFVFFPTRELVGTPADAGLEYTSVHLETEDGLRLHGWWAPAEPERAVLLFFHGNAGNISDRVDSIGVFHDLDLSVFIFDYRGYGQSQGEPSEQGTYADAEAAWTYLTEERGVPPDRIVMFGRSLGGGVAAELATRHRPRALVLESTFSSIRDMAAAAMPLVPIGAFLRTRYDTLSKVSSITAPVLVVHSRDDEVVPFEQGLAIYKAAPAPKALLELRYGHNEGFILSGETYTKGLDSFLTEHVAERPPHPKEPPPPPAADSPSATLSDDGAEDRPAAEPPMLD
jgi:hypothetical protein